MLKPFDTSILFEGVEKSRKAVKREAKSKQEFFEITPDIVEENKFLNTSKAKPRDFRHLIAIGYDPFKNAGDYYYDAEAGQRAIDFFRNELHFTKGKYKGKPFIPEPWQEDVISCIFGWKRKSDGIRRYRSVFVYIPRKAGKSQLIAGIALYSFYCDRENDAEIYIGARGRDQANTLYKMCRSMVKQNPDLDRESEIHETPKEIRATWDDSLVKAISGDALSQHSLSPSMGIIDELHAQRNGDLLEAIDTGMGERGQPILIMITTADIDRASICNDELEIAQAIRDRQIIDPTYLPIIFETPSDADWRDEEVWKKANPNYPITPTKDYMEGKVRKAERSQIALANFKRLNLNMKTSSLEGWLDMDAWRLGSEKFNEDEMAGKDCYLAFDLASKLDLCALVLFFPDSLRLVVRVYCPRDAIDRDKTGYYREWLEDKELKISGDKTTDYRFIRADIEEFDKKFNIKQIGFDPHNANTLIAELEDLFQRRLEEDENFMLEFTQTYSNYCDPAKEFEAMILNQSLKHNSRVLDWMAANVIVKEGPSGDIMPRKPKRNSPLKIDGITASIMAIALWLQVREKEEEPGFNVYDLNDYVKDD